MKRIHVLMLMFLFCIGSVLTVNAKTVTEDPNAVKVEIQELLKDHNLELEEDIVTRVLFMVNDDKELVVLFIDCKNENVKAYIRSRLNYKKIKSSMDTDFDKIVIPVKIKA
ncbi:hypothetical protein RM545_00910 [Zunongwangia sp. F260]|uniref:Uncharacterized protein n=1 Tax=Autumnicola lenta TaxID=3075593 RepID=A0ABU3CFW0_9FLAO|nr:hypothetical protein [Zunongwangia sp. F260]MDT0645233.1 hypothetical protein [Zunongwangia sp. F260]